MRWSLVFAGLLTCLSQTAMAQGLIWSLPDDGQWIRYEGTYTQITRRPDSADGDLKLQWRRNVTIKSVGREDAEFEGKVQPCRWIEIKSETGKATEGVLDAGPGGVRMYKLLVPESEIRGTVNKPIPHNREMFAEFLPVVKGFRRIGDEPAQPIDAGTFHLYPVVSLLRHFRELTDAGSQTVTTPAGEFETTLWKGTTSMETGNYRSLTTAEIYRSPTIPFGIVKWTAKTVNEAKVSTEERSEFKPTGSVEEELQVVSLGRDAESEFLSN
ncbi:hypothetical protein [Planctomicrobium sp. SH664]|uniref:hypothetical protein n=1 Tax=Planctomicrobium sp. SH664 TaxID=3448125 RepID=UPI003F5C0ED2